MFDGFGRTLVFLVAVVIFVIGAFMVLKLAVPSIRKVSPSLADTLQANLP